MKEIGFFLLRKEKMAELGTVKSKNKIRFSLKKNSTRNSHILFVFHINSIYIW